MVYTTRDRSDSHENRCAKYFDALLNPNSGAVNNYALKGDLRNTTHLIECKCTLGKSISIKKEDYYKALMQAKIASKKLLFNLEFQKENPEETKNDLKNPEDDFYNLTLVPTNDFLEYYNSYVENKEVETSAKILLDYLNKSASIEFKDELNYLLKLSKLDLV